jgi:integrase
MSIHKQRGKPYWFCAFTLYDAATGTSKRVFRSTLTTNKKQAEAICKAWVNAAWHAREGKLSVNAARDVIAQGVADVFKHANIESMPGASIKSWMDMWLEGKAKEASPATCARYKSIIARFVEFLGDAKCQLDLATLQASDIEKFRNNEAKERAIATANLAVRVLRVCLKQAKRQKLCSDNPAADVDMLKSSEESKRRAFTMSEIKRILKAANDEWRGLVLFGLYLGQRLGDLKKLTWRAVNFETNEIAFAAQKTGRRIVLPLMQPLVDYLASLPAGDNPNAHIFPESAKHKHTASLSNQFREILVEAGLIEPRDYSATRSNDRSHARESSEISFHSLRHSAVTMLKASGLSDVFAREIVGHDSEAVSRHYTHLSTDDLRNAMQRLPDVTKGAPKARSSKGTKKA